MLRMSNLRNMRCNEHWILGTLDVTNIRCKDETPSMSLIGSIYCRHTYTQTTNMDITAYKTHIYIHMCTSV